MVECFYLLGWILSRVWIFVNGAVNYSSPAGMPSAINSSSNEIMSFRDARRPPICFLRLLHHSASTASIALSTILSHRCISVAKISRKRCSWVLFIVGKIETHLGGVSCTISCNQLYQLSSVFIIHGEVRMPICALLIESAVSSGKTPSWQRFPPC